MSDFTQRFVIFDGCQTTELPFTISGLTQHGTSHQAEGFNNQDAISLLVKAKMLIGVLCDGCSSSGAAHMAINPWSFAESGAQILSILTIKHIQSLWSNQPAEKLAQQVSNALLQDIEQFLYILAGDSPTSREHVLQQMFMATILAFVVTQDQYCLMHSGDGIVAVNGNFTYLNNAHAGQYLANCLSAMAESNMPRLEVLQTGLTNDLENILLASDGSGDILREGPGLLENMLTTLDTRPNGYTQGGDRFAFLKEFRKRVGRPFEAASPKSHDDRSLIMLRRIPWSHSPASQ